MDLSAFGGHVRAPGRWGAVGSLPQQDMSTPMEAGAVQAKRWAQAPYQEVLDPKKSSSDDDISSMSAIDDGALLVSATPVAEPATGTNAGFKAHFERELQGSLPAMVSRSVAGLLVLMKQTQEERQVQTQTLRHDINRLQETDAAKHF